MSYFNYHAKAKRLIREGNLIKIRFLESYKTIKPAMVLFFKNNPPIPIREYRWKEYFDIIKNVKDFVDD